MTALDLPDIKHVTSQLFLKDTFDRFCFIEGEIVTFNTFRIDGYVQKDFFDTDTELPEYSYWKNVREYCLMLIKGKRTPLSFRLVLSLSPKNIQNLVEQNSPSFKTGDIQGLYLNITFDGSHLSCVTGTSFKTFTLDKSLEHMWDEMVQTFLKKQNIVFEQK
nr:DUF5721 family protein [uncultured Mediterraneibacter sp.]